jgi:hypothetical protein
MYQKNFESQKPIIIEITIWYKSADIINLISGVNTFFLLTRVQYTLLDKRVYKSWTTRKNFALIDNVSDEFLYLWIKPQIRTSMCKIAIKSGYTYIYIYIFIY